MWWRFHDPEQPTLSRETAVMVATHLGEYFVQQNPADLLLTQLIYTGKSMHAGSGTDPQLGGTLKDDDWLWNYESTFFAADGTPVDLSADSWSAVERMRTSWEFRWSWDLDFGDDYYSHGHCRGIYDLSGIGATATRYVLNGSADDSSSYRFSYEEPSGAYGWHDEGVANWHETNTDVRWSKDYDYEAGTGLYPLSGESSFAMYDQWTSSWHDSEGRGNESETFSGTLRITYNGTRYVPVIVDGQYTFTLDLDSGEILDPAGAPAKGRGRR
ncbi:MAG: hypothetical protein IPG61_08185 [bacterium]|nr:hypothetical protein [bacterium]